MALFNWLKKQNKNSTNSTYSENRKGNNKSDFKTESVAEQRAFSKEDIFKMILEQQAKRSPSDHFASGAVFDLSRQNREEFLNVLQSNNAMALQQLWRQTYSLFLEHPECVGFNSQMINKNMDDTNSTAWNADIFTLPNGDKVALLFMPIQNDILVARVVGIIFSSKGDGYYYCMLNKDENVPATVNRNKAMFGIEEIGEVKGVGFELMHNFLECISKDFLEY
jgi:hypothetical protein